MRTRIIDGMTKDFLDEVIEESTAQDPDFSTKVDAALRRRELARAFAEARKAKSLTQAELAKRMRTSQPVLSKLERGGDVQISTYQRYAGALGLSLDFKLVG